ALPISCTRSGLVRYLLWVHGRRRSWAGRAVLAPCGCSLSSRTFRRLRAARPEQANAGAAPMNILLFSMPDSFEHMPTIAIRMPNGALTSLAGNIDPHHRVAAADLVLVQNQVRETVDRLLAEHEPDIVGLSIMTFQRKTAKGIIDLVRTRCPQARIVVGGYDPSLAPEAYTEDPDGGVDFIVRGEGEITFRELLRALEAQRGYDDIAGLSYRNADGFRHNPARRVSGLEDGEIR